MTDEPQSAAYRAGRIVGSITRIIATVFGVIIAAAVVASNFAPGSLHGSLLPVVLLLDVLLILLIASKSRSWFWALIAVYVSLVAVGSVIAGTGDPNRAVLRSIAVGTIVVAVAAMGVAIRAGRSSTELERLVFSESSSIAFFATMLAAVTYALLESWLDFQPLSAWIFWSIGMGAWFIATVVMRGRYS